MSEKKEKPLPNTTYAVLGILSFGEAISGYEIRKWSQSLRYFYWSPAQSQIYSELRRLTQLGYVESTEIRQSGKPDKRLYQINESGKNAFQKWINEKPIEPTVMKHSLALRLFFGHAAEPGRLPQLLRQFIAEIEEGLSQLSIVEEFTEHQPNFSYPGLVARWGRNYYEAELSFAQELLTQLEDNEIEL